MTLIVSPPSPDPRHRQLRRLAKAGKLRQLYSGVYTADSGIMHLTGSSRYDYKLEGLTLKSLTSSG